MTEKNIKLIGWIGGLLLAFCGLPEVVRTVQIGDCSIGWGMLLMWYFGEIFILISVWEESKAKKWLMFNYVANIIFITVMIGYKIWNLL